jgi:hypothetical protein
MSDPRATRYRRLALVEADPAKARLLFTIADEADRGVLFTSERLYDRPSAVSRGAKENPQSRPQASDG